MSFQCCLNELCMQKRNVIAKLLKKYIIAKGVSERENFIIIP